MVGQVGIAINNTVKPFTDIRVRKALTLGFDRSTAGKVLYGITGLKLVGGLMRPGSEWAMLDGELQKLPVSRPSANQAAVSSGRCSASTPILRHSWIAKTAKSW